MNDQHNFERESLSNIKRMASDDAVREISQAWINSTAPHRYVYNWRWLGLPIIQQPPDIVVTQEIIWKVNPTVIIETGVARGGSLLLNASQLALLDLCSNGRVSVFESKRRCIGIDIDIRIHNKNLIEGHGLAPMIRLIEGSSIDPMVIRQVSEMIQPGDKVLVVLDSNHTHSHVIQELESYSRFVSPTSYLVVHDTGIENAPKKMFEGRDWGVGNNPMTAVKQFLESNRDFKVDDNLTNKLLITSSPGGYLRRL